MANANVISIADRRPAKQATKPLRMVVEISDDWNFRVIEGGVPDRASAEELKMGACALVQWLCSIEIGVPNA
jgi:hypothetical protein